jgi:hypothetical protein
MKTSIYQCNLGECEGFVLNDYSGTHTADELIANPNFEGSFGFREVCRET